MNYLTHDNGNKPFKVTITKQEEDIEQPSNGHHIVHVCGRSYEHTFIATQLFIGYSPHNNITEFSGGDGPNYDGNSIVIKLMGGEYVYIGESVFSFYTTSPIVRHISPVGSSDVPYPYSVTENGTIYLMIEDIQLLPCLSLTDYLTDPMNDPYSYYYEKQSLQTPMQTKPIIKTIMCPRCAKPYAF